SNENVRTDAPADGQAGELAAPGQGQAVRILHPSVAMVRRFEERLRSKSKDSGPADGHRGGKHVHVDYVGQRIITGRSVRRCGLGPGVAIVRGLQYPVSVAYVDRSIRRVDGYRGQVGERVRRENSIPGKGEVVGPVDTELGSREHGPAVCGGDGGDIKGTRRQGGVHGVRPGKRTIVPINAFAVDSSK